MSEIKMYWSRQPGKFVNKFTGEAVASNNGLGPSFVGTVREWYETLVECLIDASNQLARENAGKPASIVIVGSDVHVMLMASVFYKMNFDVTSDQGTIAGFKIYEDKEAFRNEVRVMSDWGDEQIATITVLDMCL